MRICRQRGVLLIAGTTFSVNLACIEGISAIVYTRRTPDTLLAVIDCVPLHSSRESAIERTLAPPGRLWGGPSNRQPIVFENVYF